MTCPKCGSEQPDRGVECTSCGIVFARFREAQERAMLARNSMSQPLPVVADETSFTVPRPLVIAAIVVVIGLGVLWTVKRKQARANYDAAAAGSEMLDEINKRDLALRRQVQQNQQQREPKMSQIVTGGSLSRVTEHKRPADFDETQAKALLERCSGFREPQQLRFPKRYPRFSRDYALREYPALEAAEKSRTLLVHIEGDDHVLTPASSRVAFEEAEDQYVVDLGQRRITGLHDLSGGANEASLRFEFVYTQRSAGDAVAAPFEQFHGFAYFAKQGGEWRVARVDGFRKDTTKLDLCR